MRRTTDEEWRTPSLKQFGSRLRALEQHDHQALSARQAPRRRRRMLLIAPITTVLVGLLVAEFVLVGGAGASSPVRRAPATAISARTLRFHSIIEIDAGGRALRRFRQAGEINFARHLYRTTLVPLGGEGSLEWRDLGGVLYLGTNSGIRPGLPHAPTRWIGVRLNSRQTANLAATPEGDALTDPIALLRIMSNLNVPAALVGRETIHGSRVKQYELQSTAAAVLHASTPNLAVPASYQATTARLKVALNEPGRPIRVTELLTRTTPRGPIILSNVLEFTGYGQPVAIQAPANARIAPALRGAPPGALIGMPSRIFDSLDSR